MNMSIQDYRAKGREVLQELNPRPNSTPAYIFNRDNLEQKTEIDQHSKMPSQKPLMPKRKSEKVNYQPVPPSIKLEAALEEAADRHFAHFTSVSLDSAIDSLEIKLDAIRLGKTSVSKDGRYDIKPDQTSLFRKGGLVNPEKDPGLEMKAESPVDKMEVNDENISEGEQTEMSKELDMDIDTSLETQKAKGMDIDMDKGKVKVTEEGIPKRIKPKKSVSFASSEMQAIAVWSSKLKFSGKCEDV